MSTLKGVLREGGGRGFIPEESGPPEERGLGPGEVWRPSSGATLLAGVHHFPWEGSVEGGHNLHTFFAGPGQLHGVGQWSDADHEGVRGGGTTVGVSTAPRGPPPQVCVRRQPSCHLDSWRLPSRSWGASVFSPQQPAPPPTLTPVLAPRQVVMGGALGS